LIGRTVQFDFSNEKHRTGCVESVFRNKSVWDEDEDSEDESRRQEAVEEANMQASFAEQTAKEMEQVMNWWTVKSPGGTLSQRSYLIENSLVYESPSTDEESATGSNILSLQSENALRDESLFLSPRPFPIDGRLNSHENLFRSPCLLDTRTNPQDLFLSPIAATKSPWMEAITFQAHKEAQEQSFAVDVVCSQVKHMEDVLVDLEDTSCDDEASVTRTSICEAQWCTLQDLPLVVRYRLVIWCFFQRYFLRCQQRLLHSLPPSLVWTWLSIQPYRKHLLHIFLPAILLAIIYITAVWNPASHTTPISYKRWESHYDSSDSGSCEFIQDLFL
jgi:hypothetical protein